MPSKRVVKISLIFWLILFLWNGLNTVVIVASESPWWAFAFMAFATFCAGWVAIDRYKELLEINR